jgi:DNA mismatch repair protein MutL
MTRIKILDAITVTQIAAGEVIDRPCSVVKELVENSIDAGATVIHVTLSDGGKREIKVTDNGHGISPEDLPLAPIRHATSKIHSFSDIYGIHSFGFRGEALASMAHVGELVIASKIADQPAYEIRARNHSISDLKPITHPCGTTIQVLDLFSFVPVRANFLKSSATEMSYCLDVLMQLAVLNPHIDFVLHHDQHRDVLNTTGISDPEILIQLLYSKESKGKLSKISCDYPPFHFQGYISNPTLTVSNKSKQVFAFNGRLIKNSTIQKAVSMAYKDYIPRDRFPLIFLNIVTDSKDVDVNVHPQKNDIKFLKPNFIFDSISKLIKATFSQTDFQYPIQEVMQSNKIPTFYNREAPVLEKQAVDFVYSEKQISQDATPLNLYLILQPKS